MAAVPGVRRQQQHAGGVAIQPVHQPRPLGRAEAQRIQHSVEVVRDAQARPAPACRAACSAPARGRRGRSPGAADRARCWGRSAAYPVSAGRRFGQRRDAHRLARGEARCRVGAMSVHSHLSGAAQLLDRTLRQPGKMAAKPAIQPDVSFVGRHDARGDGHRQLLSQETAGAYRLNPGLDSSTPPPDPARPCSGLPAVAIRDARAAFAQHIPCGTTLAAAIRAPPVGQNRPTTPAPAESSA